MKLPLLLTLAAGILTLAGCSSAPAKLDGGSIRARAFNFVARSGKPAPACADNRQAIHSMIQGAISKNLAGRGVSQVPSGGDITVAYLIIAGNNASTTSINDYFGYGGDASALVDKAHAARPRGSATSSPIIGWPNTPPNPTPLRKPIPEQAEADAAHFYSAKEEGPPYRTKS
jgi:hypothetical protein